LTLHRSHTLFKVNLFVPLLRPRADSVAFLLPGLVLRLLLFIALCRQDIFSGSTPGCYPDARYDTELVLFARLIGSHSILIDVCSVLVISLCELLTNLLVRVRSICEKHRVIANSPCDIVPSTRFGIFWIIVVCDSLLIAQ